MPISRQRGHAHRFLRAAGRSGRAQRARAEHYQEAVKFDSTFALAYAKLGTTAVNLYLRSRDSSTATEAKARHRSRAPAGSRLGDAHYALGHVRPDGRSDTTAGMKRAGDRRPAEPQRCRPPDGSGERRVEPARVGESGDHAGRAGRPARSAEPAPDGSARLPLPGGAAVRRVRSGPTTGPSRSARRMPGPYPRRR